MLRWIGGVLCLTREHMLHNAARDAHQSLAPKYLRQVWKDQTQHAFCEQHCEPTAPMLGVINLSVLTLLSGVWLWLCMTHCKTGTSEAGSCRQQAAHFNLSPAQTGHDGHAAHCCLCVCRLLHEGVPEADSTGQQAAHNRQHLKSPLLFFRVCKTP